MTHGRLARRTLLVTLFTGFLIAPAESQPLEGIGAGGGVAANNRGTTGIELVRGQGSPDVLSWDAQDNWWWRYSSATPVVEGAQIEAQFNGCAYLLAGGGRTFLRMGRIGGCPSRAQRLADAPEDVGAGSGLSGLAATGSNSLDLLWATRGGGSTDFWLYRISTDSWSPLPDTPRPVGPNSSLVAINSVLEPGMPFEPVVVLQFG